MNITIESMEIDSLREAYRQNLFTPELLITKILEDCENFNDYHIWIYRLTLKELKPYLDALKDKNIDDLPLYGIPFAIKDNIDLAAVPTTAACEAYSRIPNTSAYVVQKLIDAGAIPIGKTNMDQFATGLVGTRSPWGVCKNAFDKKYISGGSSSGSALALALGLVSFSLGTDTAGSGRIPAAFNNVIGLKPSRGLLSTQGVVPACRSLDCVSIFALSTKDTHSAFQIARGKDDEDAFSREYAFENYQQSFGELTDKPRIGVLDASMIENFGDKESESLYLDQVAFLQETGFSTEVIDFSAFTEAANLLYQGPWVSERYIACKDYLNNMLEVTRSIIESGTGKTAEETFLAKYRLAELKQLADRVLEKVDVIMIPTAPSHYRIDEIASEPIKLNSQLGYYTNFMNLLDYSAIAVPASFKANGLPFGVTFFSQAFQDINLLSIAQCFSELKHLPIAKQNKPVRQTELPAANDGYITLAVCGAHLQGLPLNWQLLQRKATLMESTQTAAKYRFYALAGGPPFRPGLMRSDNGASIEVELWRMPVQFFGSFVAGIPQPLGIGKVELADGRWVVSFICEHAGIDGAKDITELKSWRYYIDRFHS